MPVAGAILVLGLAISLAGAMMWRSSVRARERDTFQTTAANVSGTLETLLRSDTDFVRSVRAALTMQPDLSASAFKQWFALLEDHQEQPAGFGALIVKSVPAAQLESFQARRNADPAFRAFVGGEAGSIAPTGHARYCLLSAGSADILYTPGLAPLLQGDWCDPTSLIGGYRLNGTTRAQFTQAITDNGQFGAYSIAGFGESTLILEAAAYRQGAPLASVSQRRAAVLGWVLGSFDIDSLMQSALGGDHGFAVTLYHENPGLGREFIGQVGPVGTDDTFTHQTSLKVDGTWIVKVEGTPFVSGPSAATQALVVLVSGMLASILLSALVLVLTRSRERALAMVEEKTSQLRHQALHDALTGLPNRVLALDRAEQMLARARRQQQPVAALYVDVDGFKEVNDTFGHAAGDELLRVLAARLASVVRDSDTAARLAGDEFVVLVEGSTLDAGPELVAERLLEVLRKPYDIGGGIDRQLSLSASIGIAFGLRDSAEELLRDADLALYEAKAAGRDRYVLFESAMQIAAQDRLMIQMDLSEALERGQLFLLYRPTFDLQSQRMIGVEALIRWRHPTRGILPGEEFLPVAEENGLIVAIGRWALGEACRQAALWHARGQHLDISTNVSARQLDDDGLIDDVRQALADSGLEPRALTLEIAESTLMRDPQAAAERLGALKRLGVRIAIDDFASGYTSLAHLRRFPADALKIDRSFIDDIASSEQSQALIGTLVELGRMLRVDTLAEGVEDLAAAEAPAHSPAAP